VRGAVRASARLPDVRRLRATRPPGAAALASGVGLLARRLAPPRAGEAAAEDRNGMAWTTRVMVLCAPSIAAPALIAHLCSRSLQAPCEFTLVVPGGPEVSPQALAARLRAAGLRVQAKVGVTDPLDAVREAWAADRYDEVIVVTDPAPEADRLAIDLPCRVQRVTGALVTHVITAARRRP
jgi:hypothetical protein